MPTQHVPNNIYFTKTQQCWRAKIWLPTWLRPQCWLLVKTDNLRFAPYACNLLHVLSWDRHVYKQVLWKYCVSKCVIMNRNKPTRTHTIHSWLRWANTAVHNNIMSKFEMISGNRPHLVPWQSGDMKLNNAYKPSLKCTCLRKKLMSLIWLQCSKHRPQRVIHWRVINQTKPSN